MARKAFMLIISITVLGLFIFSKASEGRSFCTWHHHKGKNINANSIPRHGGCLYVIESSDTGHVEVKQENDILKCWFTERVNNTSKPAGIPAAEIVLSIKTGKAEPQKLILTAKQEKQTQKSTQTNSYFEARAPWLKETVAFEASGEVHMKGKPRKIKINYSKA